MHDADDLSNAPSGNNNPSTNVFGNSISNEALQSNPGDFDMQLYSISDDSASFMVDLLSDNLHDPVFPTPDTFSRGSPNTHTRTSTEPTINTSTGSYPSPGEILRPSDQHRLLNRLLEIQPRLLKLAMRFSEQSNTTEDVEDIYRVTETMVSIIDQVNDRSSERLQSPGLDFNGVIVLLMSSCYFSLVQAYQCLVEMLAERVNAASVPGMGDMADPSIASLRETNVPTISVGGLRLAMPRKAAAEVNLHLVAQTVQYMRGALEQCSKRMDNTRRSSHDSTYDSILGINEDSLEGQDTMKAMVSQAVEQLNKGEEKLLDRLHSLVGASNNRIFNMK